MDSRRQSDSRSVDALASWSVLRLRAHLSSAGAWHCLARFSVSANPGRPTCLVFVAVLPVSPPSPCRATASHEL